MSLIEVEIFEEAELQEIQGVNRSIKEKNPLLHVLSKLLTIFKSAFNNHHPNNLHLL